MTDISKLNGRTDIPSFGLVVNVNVDHLPCFPISYVKCLYIEADWRFCSNRPHDEAWICCDELACTTLTFCILLTLLHNEFLIIHLYNTPVGMFLTVYHLLVYLKIHSSFINTFHLDQSVFLGFLNHNTSHIQQPKPW